MKTILISLLLLLWLSSLSQYQDYQKKTFDWSNQPIPEYTNNGFENEDAVIIDEKTDIKITQANPEQAWFIVKKSIVIKYNSQEGILKYNQFLLPESFNPFYDNRRIPLKDRSNLVNPYLFNTRVDVIGARTINTEKPRELNLNHYFIQKEKRFYDNMFKTFAYKFSVLNIQEGDIVEIKYSYRIPYWDNTFDLTNFKFYFNSYIPKQKTSLTLTTPTNVLTSFDIDPDSLSRQKKFTLHKWTRTNLHNHIFEENSRAHNDLEHININTFKNTQIYTMGNKKGVDVFIPFWLNTLRYRENRAPFLLRMSRKRIFFDKQNRLLFDFMEENTKDIPDSLPIQKMIKLNNIIAEEFKYKSDYWYYKDKEPFTREKFGTNTSKSVLRDISRYAIYSKMLHRLKLPFSTVYLHDKRTGELNNEYHSSLIEHDYMFVIPTSSGRYYLYPKRGDFGLLTNEVPFYWEDNYAIATNLNQLFGVQLLPLSFINTPNSNALDNSRRTSIYADVNVQTKEIKYNSKVTLRGQFSTITRNLYKSNYLDSTVNPIYGIKTLDRVSSTASYKVDNLNYNYPFNTDISGTGKGDKKVIHVTNKEFKIPIEGFLNPIYNENFGADDRILPYYFDFKQSDSYAVVFNFNADVSVTPIENSYKTEGIEVIFKIEQISSKEAKMSFLFRITKEKYYSKDFKDLELLSRLIAQIKDNHLHFKIN